MRAVNIAELEDRPKIVPLHGEDADPEQLSLVASGHMTLPVQPLDQKGFWRIGSGMKKNPKLAKAIQQAIAADREDYAGVLGHKQR